MAQCISSLPHGVSVLSNLPRVIALGFKPTYGDANKVSCNLSSIIVSPSARILVENKLFRTFRSNNSYKSTDITVNI